MPAPSNKTELPSFLGMCNYLSPYISCLSDITSPLRQLVKKTVEFTWNSSYEKSFKEAKLHVANTATQKYFDPLKLIVLECDASGIGIGGTLLQGGQPVKFIPQALTDTQKHYSNIECELLTVVIVVEHLHHYVFGRHFTIHIDHSPLVNLFQKSLNDTSPCLQYLLLSLSQYEMDLKYVTHKCVPLSDCTSHLIDITSGKDDPSLNLQIADFGVEATVNWNEIRKSCMLDPTMVTH